MGFNLTKATMSATHPITISGDEKPSKRSKRSKRSADGAAASLSAKKRIKLPQAKFPEYTYLVKVTTTHYEEEDTSIDSAYLTKEDAINAAWNYINEQANPEANAKVTVENEHDGLPMLVLDDDYGDEACLTVYVERVKLWPAGNVTREPSDRPNVSPSHQSRLQIEQAGEGEYYDDDDDDEY